MMENSFFKTKIIEVFGLPRTGKTTSVLTLKKHLLDNDVKADIIKERASLSPIQDKLHPSFNYWTAVSFIKEYIEANDRGVEFLIADRGILDAFVWVNFLSQRINQDHFLGEFTSLVNQNFISENYLLSFCLTADIDTILKRERASSPHKARLGKGRVMNEIILEGYAESYRVKKNELPIQCELIEINTSDMALKDVTSQIIDQVCNLVFETA